MSSRHVAAQIAAAVDASSWLHHKHAGGSVADVWTQYVSGQAITSYPSDLLPLGVEILLNGSWTDITPQVYYRDQIKITRGRTSERSSSEPQSCQLTLQNTDGRFSTRNPNGIYYGKLTRNTQLRVFVRDATAPWVRQYRFWGEVAEWPSQWDSTGTDVYVPITANGLMRRLSQSSALRSAYFRGCTGANSPIVNLQAYWPMEDGILSVTLASGLSGGNNMTYVGVPVLATDSTSFVCSDALPTMGTATFSGTVQPYTATNIFQVRALVSVPSGGITNNAVIWRTTCSGTANRYDVYYTTGGNLGVKVYDRSANVIKDTGAIAFGVNGKAVRLSLQAQPSGGDIAIALVMLVPGATSGTVWNDTVTSATVGSVKSVTLAPQKDCASLTVGQVTVQSSITSIFADSSQLAAYAGETAATRINRLCSEEGYACLAPENGTALMGAQGLRTLLDLLRECEDVDQGFLGEQRDAFGILYLPRNNMSTQFVDLALNYAAFDLSAITPTEDDQNTVNDVTATRSSGSAGTGGSSARFIVSTGTLSTQAPPNGVGIYATSVDVNCYLDSQLSDQASWRAYLGTIDEARYPDIGIDFGRVNFAQSTALNVAAVRIELADRLTVSNPPPWLPPDTISQIVIGMTEVLDQRTRKLDFVCVPESAYHVIVWDQGSVYNTRYDGTDSSLAAPVGTTDTTFSVASASGVALWTISDGSFDAMIEGERVTVTNVVGASSPQTFTVTRSVNGIVNTHPAGASISLFTPYRYSL